MHPYYAILRHHRLSGEASGDQLACSLHCGIPLTIHLRWQPGRAQRRQVRLSISNATVGYRLAHGLWVGANGYFLKQVTAPQIDGAPLRDSPEQVGAIGPGAVWDLKRFLLYASAYHELGAENRPKGNRSSFESSGFCPKERITVMTTGVSETLDRQQITS